MLADILDTPTAWLQIDNRPERPSGRRYRAPNRSSADPHAKESADADDLLACVREAVVLNAFTVVFQPILDAKNREIVGAEALLRWPNATHKANRPVDFVPVLEASGLIKRVGAQVLEEACRAMRDLRTRDGLVKVSVNISPKQFTDPGLANLVESILRDNAFAPERLEIEITENAIEDFPQARATMLALKTLGVGVVIDDFGVGYSSLGHLKKLPVSGLKLDRSFVVGALKSRHDRLITESIIQLAHDLKLEIVAEGIEDIACERWLCARGVDRLQGFLYSEGINASALTDMLIVQPFANDKVRRKSRAARQIKRASEDG
jgi:EAL domain-containing protein (putative c-di-GMP-specific phosphodiesterase class I)